MKNKFFLISVLSLVSVIVCGCSTDGDSSVKESLSSSSESGNYTVTFHYGFTADKFNSETGLASEYLYTLEMASKNGKKISISNTVKARFNCVDGYDLVGYDDTSWETGVSANMDVHCKYTKLQEVTVTFKDYFGDTIKDVTSYVGGSLKDEQMPDTTSPIYVIETNYYNSLTTTEKSSYELYKEGYYIDKTDKTRIGTALLLPLGNVFTGWNGTLAGFTENCTITPETINYKTHSTYNNNAENLVAYTSSAIAIDGSKDAGYAKIGTVMRKNANNTNYADLISDWSAENFEATLYMAHDSSWIYFFVDVDDASVFTFGKDFNEKIENPYVQDNIEIWYSIGGYRFKFVIDAFGYEFHSVTAQTSGQSVYFENFIKPNCVTTLKGANLTALKDGTAKQADGATGYTVEFKMPAYFENTETTITQTFGASDWGKKMNKGDYFYVGLQADNVKAMMTQTTIDACVEAGNSALDSTFISSSFTPYGYQITSDKRVSNALLLVLG